MNPIYSLIASLIVLLFGPLVYETGLKKIMGGRWVQTLMVLVVLGFIGAEVTGHANHINFGQFAAFMVGSLVLTRVLESYFARKFAEGSGGPRIYTLIAIVVGMAAHALMDGVVLRESVFYLPMAIIIHRLPASLLIWQLVAGRGRPALAVTMLAMIGLGTVLGYAYAGALVPSHDSFQYVQAVVAGALLHVAFHSHSSHSNDPHGHS